MRLIEIIFYFIKSLTKELHALHHSIGFFHNLLLILHLPLMRPRHLQDPQKGIQVLTTCDKHPLFVSLFPKSRFSSKCKTQRTLTKHIHHHKIKALSTSYGIVLCIILAREFFDMRPHRSYMTLQSCSLFRFVGGVIIIFKSLERNFRINHYVSFVGKMKNHVRNHLFSRFIMLESTTSFIAQSNLLFKLHAFFKPHIFQQSAQAKFSKVTLCLILSRQRRCQTVSTLSHQLSLHKSGFNAFI